MHSESCFDECAFMASKELKYFTWTLGPDLKEVGCMQPSHNTIILAQEPAILLYDNWAVNFRATFCLKPMLIN